jgi:aarF domain-containing kinase
MEESLSNWDNISPHCEFIVYQVTACKLSPYRMVLPGEWTSTMRPLQDQCEPTPYEAVDALFRSDMNQSISELFDEFDPNPIGVASLAQVHVARHKSTGQEVAVKLQHPHLAEFCDIDMNMVQVTLGWIKYWFPEFEFTWLAGEMRENLPKEMDFTHEAVNAARAKADFAGIRTSLYIPAVIYATNRVLIMEYVRGGRVDDLEYLAKYNIDRNKVSLELARIFSQMVYLNGFFHAVCSRAGFMRLWTNAIILLHRTLMQVTY